LILLTDFEEMLLEATQTSEMDTTMMALVQYKKWRAVDMYYFLLTRVGLLAARKDFTSDQFYDMLVELADLTYWMNYGRVTKEVVEKVRLLGNSFAEKWKSTMTEEDFVWKWHALVSHFYRVMEAFGGAHQFDSFILEFLLGEMIRFSTSRRNVAVQVVMNMLSKFHSSFRKYKPYFGPTIREWLKRKGFDNMNAPRLSIHRITKMTGPPAVCDSEALEIVKSAEGMGPLAQTVTTESVTRVLKIRFGAMCLTSADFVHRGKIRDYFVQVDGELFGKICDIFEIVDVHSTSDPKYVLNVQIYKPVENLKNSRQDEGVLFPVNQVPREPSDDFFAVLLRPNLFVQKAIEIDFPFFRDSISTFRPLKLYCILPNEYGVR
jgi:hypothetical protein